MSRVSNLFTKAEEHSNELNARTTDTSNTRQKCKALVLSAADDHGMFTLQIEREGSFNGMVEAILSCSAKEYEALNKIQKGDVVWVEHVGGRFDAFIVSKANDTFAQMSPKDYAKNNFRIPGAMKPV